MEFDLLLRSARREAGLSQRQLAARAVVPRSTVSRIEAGNTSDPRLQTIERLLDATGHRLLVCDADGVELAHSHPDDQLRDRGGRRFPAHLPAFKVRWFDGWWGWFRIAWDPRDPVVPQYSYFHPRGCRGARMSYRVPPATQATQAMSVTPDAVAAPGCGRWLRALAVGGAMVGHVPLV